MEISPKTVIPLTSQGAVGGWDTKTISFILAERWNHVGCDRLHNQGGGKARGIGHSIDFGDEYIK